MVLEQAKKLAIVVIGAFLYAGGTEFIPDTGECICQRFYRCRPVAVKRR